MNLSIKRDKLKEKQFYFYHRSRQLFYAQMLILKKLNKKYSEDN